MLSLRSILIATALFTGAVLADIVRLEAPAVEAFDQLPLQHHEYVGKWTVQQREKHAADDLIWIRPGILANRATREATLWADATGLTTDNPLEFLLISESSGHDYEALAVSYAVPSDIRAALEFIGVPAGAPVNPLRLRFYPKGEPIAVTIEWTQNKQPVQWRAESLVRDRRTGATLPENGFTFVGSDWIERGDEGKRLAADVLGPGAIISLYNETTTVLDMPGVFRQTEVYGYYHPHPDRIPPKGTLMSVRLKPVRPLDAPLVADLVLHVQTGDEDRPIQVNLRKLTSGEPLHDSPTLDAVMVALSEVQTADRKAFVQLQVDQGVPINEVRDLSRILQQLEQDGVLQVEPPVEGKPYYRAFMPVERHRERANRPSQVLELDIQYRTSRDSLKVELNQISDLRERREDGPTLDVLAHLVETPEDLKALVEEINHRLPVLIVFAPEDLPYGQLLEWLSPVIQRHPTVHVFMTPGFEDVRAAQEIE